MKKLLIIHLIIFLFLSCSHKRNGLIVKDKNGNFYRLNEGIRHEEYYIEQIDTTIYKTFK